jgi:DNA-binding MarR family transcriptional regulator
MQSQSTVKQPQANPPLLPCTCATLRRAARAVTRLYNQELRSEQIEITQFTILMALERTGEISQGKLGKLLALDSTTLTRMLRLLKKHGWVQETEGEDRRFRMIRLTTTGKAKWHKSLPRWKRAQEGMQRVVGEQALSQLGGLLAQVMAISSDR